jgi:hypothetical protein
MLNYLQEKRLALDFRTVKQNILPAHRSIKESYANPPNGRNEERKAFFHCTSISAHRPSHQQ